MRYSTMLLDEYAHMIIQTIRYYEMKKNNGIDFTIHYGNYGHTVIICDKFSIDFDVDDDIYKILDLISKYIELNVETIK